MPEITKRLNGMGFEVVGTTPAEFKAHVQNEVAKWAQVVKQSGAKL
jgi:tripartite-type tricarboxylate transporter receptor subunit TctC